MNSIYVILSLISLAFLVPNLAFASPIVPHQEIQVPTGFSNIGGKTAIGYDSLNFQTVTYVSDGNFLNATYFMNENFNPIDTDVATYGMLIGVDAKSGNGQGGINFIYSQTWDNGKWDVKYQQITSSGDSAIFYEFTQPYDGKINQDKFVNLSLDLKRLGSPDYYDIIFFSEGEVNKTRFHIITGPPLEPYVDKGSSLVFIPTLSINMETFPSPLMLLPGDHKDITLRLKTNTNLNLPVMVQVPLQSNNGVIVNEFNQFHNYTFSDGTVDIPIEVRVPDNLSTSLQTFTVTMIESFNRNASVNGENINNKLIKDTLYTTNPLYKYLQLEIPVGTSLPKDYSVYAPWVAVGVTAVGIGMTSFLTIKSNRLTQSEIKARIRPILARTEIGDSALKRDPNIIVLIDHAISPKKALFQFTNVGHLSAIDISKKSEIKIKGTDGIFTDLKSFDSQLLPPHRLPDMAPNEQYSIDIDWDPKHHDSALNSDNCYFELILKYKDVNKKEYKYDMKGHFFDGGYIYLDSVETTDP